MQKEDGVVETSHVILRIVQVLVDLAELMFVVLILESGGRGTEDAEQNEREHRESEEHCQGDYRRQQVRN